MKKKGVTAIAVVLIIASIILGGVYMFYKNIEWSVESKAGQVTELYDGEPRTLDRFLMHGKGVAIGQGDVNILSSVRIESLEKNITEKYVVILSVDKLSYKEGNVIAYGEYEKIIRPLGEDDKKITIPIKYEHGIIVGIDGNELEELKDFGFYFELQESLLLSDISNKKYDQTLEVPFYTIIGKLDEKKSKKYFEQNQSYFVQKGITSFDDYHVVETELRASSGTSTLQFSNVISNGVHEIEISEGVSTRYSIYEDQYKEAFYAAIQEGQ